MKTMALSLLCLLGLQTVVLAQSTRVEQFHHKHYIQSPSHISPYIRPYRAPVRYHDRVIVQQPHRIISQRPRVEYRYAPRENYYPRQRVIYPQRVYPSSCDVQAPTPYTRRHYRVGQRLRELPYGCVEVVIDDRRYYQYEDVYFLPQRRSGVRMYLVVDF